MTGISAAEEAQQRLCSADDVPPSAVVKALRPLTGEFLPLFLALCSHGRGRQLVQSYLSTWRHLRTELTGADLKRLGVPQGPDIGRVLARVLAAKLDGDASTREAEEALVQRWLVGLPAQA